MALDVLVDDVVVAQVIAESFRRDLLNEGLGAGSHGFFIDLTALQAQSGSVIRVRVAGHGIDIANSGKRLQEFTQAA